MTKDGKESKEFAKALGLCRELRADVRNLKDSTKFCSNTWDKVDAIRNEVKHLRKEIKELMKQNTELQNESQRLSQCMEEPEQYQHSNLEIKWVPLEGDPYDRAIKAGDSLN